MLNKASSNDEKKKASEALFEALSDAFFDKITFLTAPGNTNSGADVTSTTTFNVGARIPDTSKGDHVTHDGNVRFRTNFYIGGTAESFQNTDLYFLLLATWDSTTAPSTSDITDALTSFVGIHVLDGDVSIVSKDNSGFKEFSTSERLTGNSTYQYELRFNGSSAEIAIDGNQIGTARLRYNRSSSDIVLYPFIGAIRSTDGTSVRLNMENYQFIQKR